MTAATSPHRDPRTTGGAQTDPATYVYCVVRSPIRPDLRGVPRGLPGAGAPRAVGVGHGLWLIAADAPLARYGEAALARVLRDLDAVSRCALAHSAVIAHCARRSPVLPLRMLTLFANDERALAQVRRRRRALQGRLARVAGRAEWGVQGRMEAIGGRHARRRRAAAREATATLGPGARFLELRRRERRETQDLAADARRAAASLYRTFARLADSARQRPPVAVDGGPSLFLDAAFLVPRARATRFRQAVRAQATHLANQGLRIRLTGPWPPYSFVTGRL